MRNGKLVPQSTQKLKIQTFSENRSMDLVKYIVQLSFRLPLKPKI